MAFPHLQQPSFLLVSVSCPPACQGDGCSAAEGLEGFATDLKNCPVVMFWGDVLEITLDSGENPQARLCPLLVQDLGFMQLLSPGFLIYKRS